MTRVLLSDRDWLIRTSLALRGVRPPVADMVRLRDDPSQAATLVDEYLQTPEFVKTVEDLHSDLFQLHTDSLPQLPAFGRLDGYTQQQIYNGTTSEPLHLVGRIVAEDRPYTDLVTATTTQIDAVGAMIWGLPYDFNDPTEWQETAWADGRPLAGILSSGRLWQRHESAGSNFHRGRANVIADFLLCEPFATRDIIVAGGIDLSDEAAVAHAVDTIPACVSCHKSLDPLAALFWGFKNTLRQTQVAHAYAGGCDDNFHDAALPELGPSYLTSDFCYPLQHYSASDEDDWAVWGLDAPGFYAQPVEDLTEAGALIASDPRFSRCAVKNFVSYLAEVDRTAVPEDLTTRVQEAFAESEFSVKALARAIVLSEEFRGAAVLRDTPADPMARMRTIRPEHYAATLEDLTGFAWIAAADPPDCATLEGVGFNGSQCWGPVDLGRSDRFGFRSMSGGTDAYWVVVPTHEPAPIKVLAMEHFASNAAGYVVDHDFSLPAADRKLLTGVEADTRDEAAIRDQLVALQLRILGEDATPDDAIIDETWALFQAASPDDSATAWKVVLTAMFQDPRMMFN